MRREKSMTKKEFIDEIRKFADELENGGFGFVYLESGYIFGNKNYGELNIEITKGVNASIYLYTATDEEKDNMEENEGM